MENGNTTDAFPEVDGVLRQMNDEEVTRLIPTVAFLTIIATLGIVGNGMVIHVYRTRYKISNSKLFIISVGLIDLFSCAVAIPFEIPLLLEQYTFDNVWLCKVSRFFNTLGTCSSSFILLFIAIDRYRKVCKPLARQITPKSARFLCLFSVALGLFVSWPALFVYGKKTFEFKLDGSMIVGSECSTSDTMSDSKIPFYYAALFFVLFLAGITSMSILYCFIGCKIKRQARKMSQTFSVRTMSIPMVSSIAGDRDSRKSGEIVPGAYEKYEIARKKNESINKKKEKGKSKRKRSESLNDDSWTDKKDFELSYEYKERSRENSKSEDLANGIGNKNGGYIPEIPSINEIVDPTTQNDDNSESEGEETDNCDNKTVGSRSNGTLPKDNSSSKSSSNCDHVSSSTLTSSGELQNPDKTFRQRVSSIGSRISHVLTRMTSITSVSTSKSLAGTLRKNQYLKQARARKTAFIMFIISITYVISYLPHLILMVLRQANGEFVDNLSDTDRAIYKFFLRSYFLNCAINPLIYSVCDSRFRSACAELFGRCRISGNSDD